MGWINDVDASSSTHLDPGGGGALRRALRHLHRTRSTPRATHVGFFAKVRTPLSRATCSASRGTSTDSPLAAGADDFVAASVGGAGAVAAERAGYRDREHDEAVEARRGTGWSIGHTCFVTGDVGLPNIWRVAATNTLTGFNVAIHCSTVGSDSIGTNALLRNVSGNTTMNATPITASGERTIIPSQVPTQIIAEQNMNSRRNAPVTWNMSACKRQPTMNPP